MNCPKCNDVMTIDHFWKGGIYINNDKKCYDFELWDFCQFCHISGKTRATGILYGDGTEKIKWIKK